MDTGRWVKILVETDVASVHLILAQWLFGAISPENIIKASKAARAYWQAQRFGVPNYWSDKQIHDCVTWCRENYDQ
jgi:hypothetical protein